MPRFKVIAEFVDLETGKRLKPGEVVDASEVRAERLHKAGVIGEEIESPKAPEPSEDPGLEAVLQRVGGGYYVLPDGRKVHGKQAALKALAESGDNDGAEIGGTAGN